ncbi:MAG: cation:proton antiporter [candidate division Zixibacteria bacterium]
MRRFLPNRKLFIFLIVLSTAWFFSIFTMGTTPAQETTDNSTQLQIKPTEEIENVPAGTNDSNGQHNEVSDVLLGLIVILLAAKIGGDMFERVKQPAVLGELIFGMIIGNLYLVGIDIFEPFKHSVTLEVLAEIGVIILLFQVGLESSIGEMMKVGLASFMVATFGVVAPFFLGWGVGAWFLPNESIYVHIFIGATLTATSVGITARVLQDIGKIKTKEAKIILGAAVIDDIMGLVILAVVAGIIAAASEGGTLSSGSVFLIVAKAVIFVIGSLILGRLLSPYLFKMGAKMKVKGVLLSLGLLICFLFAYIANMIGLAPIVGAFAAGLILEKIIYKDYTDRGEHGVDDLIEPIAIFLVPIFFVRMGMMVQLETFAHLDILFFAAVMSIVAIVGKQVCSLAILDKNTNRFAIGLGMIPRGEVGLIFAGIGAKLMLHGEPVISGGTFSAIIIMVIVTTLVTPPFLKYAMLREPKKKTGVS